MGLKTVLSHTSHYHERPSTAPKMASARMQSRTSWSGRMTSPNRRILSDASPTCPRIMKQSKHCKIINAPRRASPVLTRSKQAAGASSSSSYIEDKTHFSFQKISAQSNYLSTYTHTEFNCHYNTE